MYVRFLSIIFLPPLVVKVHVNATPVLLRRDPLDPPPIASRRIPADCARRATPPLNWPWASAGR
jgi:hypothetical protein